MKMEKPTANRRYSGLGMRKATRPESERKWTKRMLWTTVLRIEVMPSRKGEMGAMTKAS